MYEDCTESKKIEEGAKSNIDYQEGAHKSSFG